MFDVAIVGLGISGTCTFYHVAKSGLSCIAFEKNKAENNIASSQGPSRIIRQAYFEGADYYKPFINRAYEIWDDLEKETGIELFKRCGIIYFDTPDCGEIVKEVVNASIKHNYDVERQSLTTVEKNQPFFKIRDRNYEAVIEKNGGILLADKCLSAMLNLVKEKYKNAHIADETKIVGISKNKDGTYTIIDNKSKIYTAKHLVISAGSWNLDFFESFKGLKKYRKHFRVENALVTYFKFKDSKMNNSLKMPFYIGKEKHHLYGFPDIGDGNYLKIGIYKYYDGDDRNFEDSKSFDKQNFNDLVNQAQDYLRDFTMDTINVLGYSRCTYTITKDEHYIIDRIPKEENAYIISACSGHGFKFGTSIGEYVANLIQKKAQIIPFFGLSRLENSPTPKF